MIIQTFGWMPQGFRPSRRRKLAVRTYETTPNKTARTTTRTVNSGPPEVTISPGNVTGPMLGPVSRSPGPTDRDTVRRNPLPLTEGARCLQP
jgi:hypothetical protein